MSLPISFVSFNYLVGNHPHLHLSGSYFLFILLGKIYHFEYGVFIINKDIIYVYNYVFYFFVKCILGNINTFYWEKKYSTQTLICVLEIWKVCEIVVANMFATIQSLPYRLNIHDVRESLVSASIPRPESLSKFCRILNQFISGKMVNKVITNKLVYSK